MKLSVALPFEKYIYLTENPNSKLLLLEMMKLVMIHNISVISKSRYKIDANKISSYLVQFKNPEQNLILFNLIKKNNVFYDNAL